MAFITSLVRPTLILRMLLLQGPKYFIKSIHNHESKRNEVDALDEFTTQLLQKKSDKWENIRYNKNVRSGKNNNTILILNKEENVNICNMKTETIDSILDEYVEIENIEKVMLIAKQCIEYKMCPSFKILERVLSFCAQNGQRDIILALQKLVEELNPEILTSNSNFLHYIAEATWMRGNVTEGIKQFNEVYKNNVYLRRKIRLMIKYLITNIISQRSEATLITVIHFTENLVKDYNDYFLLSCIWQACFLSEWFADQKTAAEILERHKELCYVIVNRIPFVVNLALRNHQPETVHRLLEVLLKYEMKPQYTKVLQALFNYRYWQNDLRNCAEILQWCINLSVPLSNMQHEQFLKLLVGHQISKVPIKNKKPQSFKFKF